MQAFHRIDAISAVSAIAVHAVIAIVLVSIPPQAPKASTTIEVEVVKPPPPPPEAITPPKQPEPPPPPKVIEKVKVAPPPEATPPPNKTPPAEPPKAAPIPVFGVNNDDVVDKSDGPSVPVGDTTMIDPKNSAKSSGQVQPLGPGTPGAPMKDTYKPVLDVYIKKFPEIDSEACARMVTYPSEAEQLGIEGEVKLKVWLDETGKVHDIKVTKGLGHGLDQAALNALRYKCKFKPAVGTDGKAAAYVIQTYTWTFELPR